MKYAGFFRRIFSLVYDSFLVLGIILVFTFGLVFLHGGYEKMGIVGQILQLFIILLSGPCYYIYFW
jgi:RDD family.